jgi:hypothetical protein
VLKSQNQTNQKKLELKNQKKYDNANTDDENDVRKITDTKIFFTHFIFKLIKNIEDESTKKKFLNHATILDLVDLNWHAMPGFI